MENQSSTTKLSVQNVEDNKAFIPYVIEPSAGVDRGVLALLNEAYNDEKLEGGNSRIVLKLKPHLSPIKAAVIPLKKNNEEIVKLSKELKITLQKIGLGRIMLENSGNIGKNYRRHDEIGTPICVTVDFETLDDKTVTVRDRDSMEQKRINIDDLTNYYTNYFN